MLRNLLETARKTSKVQRAQQQEYQRPANPPESAPSASSDFDIANKAVSRSFPSDPATLPTAKAPPELTPFGDVGIYGDGVVTGMPGEVTGLGIGTADVAASETLATTQSLPWLDAAGTLFSAAGTFIAGRLILVTGLVGALVLTVGGIIYYANYSSNPPPQDPQQASISRQAPPTLPVDAASRTQNNLTDQLDVAADPLSDANRGSFHLSDKAGSRSLTRLPSNSRYDVNSSVGNYKNSGGAGVDSDDRMQMFGYMTEGEGYFIGDPTAWEQFKQRHPDYKELTAQGLDERQYEDAVAAVRRRLPDIHQMCSQFQGDHNSQQNYYCRSDDAFIDDVRRSFGKK